MAQKVLPQYLKTPFGFPQCLPSGTLRLMLNVNPLFFESTFKKIRIYSATVNHL